MNPEEIKNIDDIEGEDESEDFLDMTKERERLFAVIACGNSKKYLGKEFQLSDIDSMTPEEIKKLYCKYEISLQGRMTKTLGNSFINFYVLGALAYFNITDPIKLKQDLKEDPFVEQALTTTCCELYHRFGAYLAPLTTMLTTAKHIKEPNKNDI